MKEFFEKVINWFKQFKLIDDTPKIKNEHSAFDQYTMTKYNRVKTEEQIKSSLISDINYRIRMKSDSRDYAIMLPDKGDINKYKDYIIDYYQKLDYVVSEVTVKVNPLQGTTPTDGVHFLIISWAY